MIFIYFPYYLSRKLIHESFASENPGLMLAENMFNIQILFQQTVSEFLLLPHELSNLILTRNEPFINVSFFN